MDLSEPVTMPVVAKAISWGNAERLTVSSSVLAALPKRCTQYRNTAKTDKLTRLCPTDAGMENLQVERLRVRNALGWRSVVWRIGNVRPPRPGPFADPRERDGAFPLRHRSNPVLQLRVGTGLRPALSGGSGRSASRGGSGIRLALSGEGIGAVGRLLVGGGRGGRLRVGTRVVGRLRVEARAVGRRLLGVGTVVLPGRGSKERNQPSSRLKR